MVFQLKEQDVVIVKNIK